MTEQLKTYFVKSSVKFTAPVIKKDEEVAAQIRLVEGRRFRDLERLDEAISIFQDIVENGDYSAAPEARRQAMIELGRSFAWSGKPAEAQKWLDQVVDDGSAPDADVSQALFELGITTVLASQDATPRWKAMAWKRSPISPGSVSRLTSLWRWWRSTGSAIVSMSARHAGRPFWIRKAACGQ